LSAVHAPLYLLSAPPVAFGLADAPWGPIHVAASVRGIVAIELLTPTARFVDGLGIRLRRPVEPAAASSGQASRLVTRAIEVIGSYLGGDAADLDLPVDLDGIGDWDRAVYGGLRGIGRGEVTSYGRLARRIGRKGAARAVGGSVGRNPLALVVPCHRVIAGDGSLGGYGGAWWGAQDEMLEIKRTLLALEGVSLPVRFRD
jgi:methylated-DNA-[protein]-cysteine S-methyltransferase